jgi:hypothetical protein
VQLFPAFAGMQMNAEWLVVDTHFPNWPFSAQQQAADLARLRGTVYRTVAEADGFVLLRKT